MKYGCIGERLPHSFSKEIHNLIADYDYEICEIERGALGDFINARDFLGINVTIPYKEAVMPYLDYIDSSAEKIGAVNTVVKRGERLLGYNTDFRGMVALFSHAGITPATSKVLILGTGGTSKTARAVVEYLGARECVRVSRSPKNEGECDYDTAYKLHRDAEIIVNTTPVGMYPNIYERPIDISKFDSLSGVIDVIYNPLRTPLVLDAMERGIRAEGGLYMLVAQAVYASEIFLDTKYGEGVTEDIYRKILSDKENLVLVGMPGSGKSTVGGIIADELKKTLSDTDVIIEEGEKISPSEIIRDKGESAFRDIESGVIHDVAKGTRLVISTGGGAVLREENVRALRQNGRIYFIDRALSNITPTDSRPLTSTREALAKRFNERYSIYKSISDVIIENNSTAESAAVRIISSHRERKGEKQQ